MKERKTQNNKKFENSYGFTLIEMMVAISLFAVVMVIVIAALLGVNNANKRAQRIRAVVDNLSYSIEDMTRKIRTGSDYHCGDINSADKTCPTGNLKMSFIGPPTQTTSDRRCYMYYFNDAKKTIMRREKGVVFGGGSCEDGKIDDAKEIQTIASEVKIDSLKFHVIQDPAGGVSTTQQPIVIITISGRYDIDDGTIVAPFSLQTTVSQRSATE